MEKEPITSQGLEKLKKELEELKNIIQSTKNGAINIFIYHTEKSFVV